MTLNKQTFRTRAITAVIFVIVMLAGLLWNQWSFLVLFSIIHFGCWWEYLGLIEKIHKTSFHLYTKLGLMVMGYGLMLWFCGSHWNINGYGIRENISLPVTASGFAVLILGIFQKNQVHPKGILAAVLGIFYISLSWGLMLDLYSTDLRATLGTELITQNLSPVNIIPPILVFSIWINDTMAYIVGSFIGKTPLSSISPKKTWEGTIGGIILAVIVITLLIMLVFDFSILLPWYYWMIIPAVAAITGTFGDLLESKLKRMAGVKDSGSMMPGHGGFLDRFDSMLLATPFVWLLVNLIRYYL